MTCPRTLPISALLLLILASPARSDCPGWVPGLLDDGGPNNGADQIVECILPFDPDGAGPLGETLAMAGAFTTVEGQPAKYLAMRNPTTGRWQGMGEVAGTAGFNALTVFNGELIAGGGADIDPLDRDDNILRWDGTAWQSMDGGTNTGTVRVLHVHNGVLYAAGSFVIERPMQPPIVNIAKWNPSSEEWEPLNGALSGAGMGVNAMITFGADLIVGGNFLTAGGVTVNGVAKYNGSAWSAMGAGMSGGGVGALQGYLGTVYIGGSFNSSNGVTTGGFARWNGTNWVPASTIFPGQVQTLGVHAGQLILGGSFVHTAQNFEQYNGGAYSSIGGAGMTFGPSAMLSHGGMLYIGGYFNQVGSTSANHVAMWDGITWLPFGGGTAGQVRAFTSYLGLLVVAGGFDQSAEPGLPAHNIAGSNGARLWNYEEGTNGAVLSLKSHKYPGVLGSYELIAGGLFTVAGTVAANRIARWNERPNVIGDDPEWAAMGAGFNNGVYAIERHADATYAGGTFTASGATTVNRIARWNETSDVWEPMGTGMNGTVYALKSFGGFLYAGGSFTTAGGVSTGGLARWNGTSWSAVGLGFTGAVYALEIHNNALVIAGSFPGFGGSPNLTSWSGSFYVNPAPGGTDGEVFALHSFGGYLYLGGSFSNAGGLPMARVASYGPGGWFEIDDGADDNVYALMNHGGEVNAGGWFGTVRGGTLASPRWARYSLNGLPWVATNPSGQTIAAGGNASFTSQVVPGTNPVALRWHYYDVPLTDGVTNHGSTIFGATTTTLQIANISGYDVGQYRLVAWSVCGSDTSATARLDLPYTTGVPPVDALPTAFEAIAPNPTLGSSVLTFTLERDADVRMRVHDVRGRVVRTIGIGRLPAGRHQTPWNARAGAGSTIRAGIYFVRLEVDGRPVGMKRVAVL